MTKTNQKRLDDRVKGRLFAKETMVLLNWELDHYTEDSKKTFWEEFGGWIDRNRPIPEHRPKKKKSRDEIVPMADSEARAFGDIILWFGQHKGSRVKDVLSYIDYMVGKDPKFMDSQAKRYLANEKVAELVKQILDKDEE